MIWDTGHKCSVSQDFYGDLGTPFCVHTWATRTISKILVALLAKGPRAQACSSTVNEDDREAKGGCSGRLRARDGREALGNMGLECHVFINGTEKPA